MSLSEVAAQDPRSDVYAKYWLLAVFGLVGVSSIVLFRVLLATRPAGLYWWTWLLAGVQGLIGEFLRRRYFPETIPVATLQGWPWALAALVGLQLAQYTMASPTMGLRGGAAVATLELFKYVILIGYVEELWFRGVWFGIFRNRFVPCVIVGSIVFGLYHIAHGVGSVLMTTFVGGVYAAARYRGASIAALGLAHGLMNWFNAQMFPATGLRVGHSFFAILFPVMCMILAAVICLWGRGGRTQQTMAGDKEIGKHT